MQNNFLSHSTKLTISRLANISLKEWNSGSQSKSFRPLLKPIFMTIFTQKNVWKANWKLLWIMALWKQRKCLSQLNEVEECRRSDINISNSKYCVSKPNFVLIIQIHVSTSYVRVFASPLMSEFIVRKSIRNTDLERRKAVSLVPKLPIFS